MIRSAPLEVVARVRGEMSAVNELRVVNGGDHSLAITKTQLKTSAETHEDVDQHMLMTIQKFVGGYHPHQPIAADATPYRVL